MTVSNASRAVVFPGQGSQKSGMAQDFHDAFDVSARVFEEASDALNLDLRALVFQDDPRLELTEYTQPAILTAEVAMFRAMEAEWGFGGAWFGGHSLGEYTALVVAGVIPLGQAVVLVRERGRRMQVAVAPGVGAMAALIRPELDPVEIARCLEGLEVDVANHNAPNQVVISGTASDVETATVRLANDPAGEGARIRSLSVSAPFHCRLMAGIEPGFRELLTEASQHWELACAGTVLSNHGGGFHAPETGALVDALTRQISGTVCWVDNMQALVAQQPSQIVEIGPARPLRGFFRGIGASVDAVNNLVMARRAVGVA